MLSHYIRFYDSVDPDLCDRCIAYFEANSTKRELLNESYRRCTQVYSINNTSLWPELSKALRDNYERYKSDIGCNLLNNVNSLESPLLFKYSNTGEINHFHNHADSWSYDTASRVISIILYFNDVDLSGETSFDEIGIKVNPKKGRILLFPSNLCFMHSGKQPISNDKYILVTWIHFEHNFNHAYTTIPF
jgi:hypothetical protein